MADEITITAKLALNKDGYDLTQVEDGAQFDWSGTNSTNNTITVGTAEVAIDVSMLPTLGWAFFRNWHATNSVQVGRLVSSAFLHIATVGPGEYCLFPLAAAPYVKATGANTPLSYRILSAS